MSKFNHIAVRCNACGTMHYGIETRARARMLRNTSCQSCRNIITQLGG